jgi:hypothetical protein
MSNTYRHNFCESGTTADGVIKMYISINKEFFEKTKDEAWKTGLANIGEENKEYVWEECPDRIDECYVNEDDEIYLSLRNDLGYFSADIAIDDELLIEIIQLAVKRMNKIKSAFESLK